MAATQRFAFDEFIVKLNIPPPASDRASCFAYSLHKAGSTLLFDMLRDLAPHVGLTYFSLEDRLFALGIGHGEKPLTHGDLFAATGYLYGGFRWFDPACKIADFKTCKKILLVRHPLDILVSRYFSFTQSHSNPGGGNESVFADHIQKQRNLAAKLDVEQFALQIAQERLAYYLSYSPILTDKNLAIYRYEDIIYDKAEFMRQICAHLGFRVAEDVIDEIAARYDVFPQDESPGDHVRQVHPGNYRKHLSPNAIEFLLEYFDPILRAFGYKPCGIAAHAVLDELRILQERVAPQPMERTAIELLNEKLDRLIIELAQRIPLKKN
jgi:hypothetical protein